LGGISLIYDKAHDLAQALKLSEEYRSFLTAKEALSGDTEAQNMVRVFLAKKMEVEYEVLGGKGEDQAKMEQLRRMYDLLAHKSKAREFLEAHARFQRIMADVSKIIGEAVAGGLDIFAKG